AKTAFASVLSLSLLTQQVSAAVCTGQVKSAGVSPDGNLIFTLVGPEGTIPENVLCNVNSESRGISATICRSILKNVQLALVTQKNTFVYFNYGVEGNCKNFKPWVHIKDNGDWYHGPVIHVE
ncbi:MAG: hypothetical protein ACRDAM_04805, partial [Casimicrobium sp.]